MVFFPSFMLPLYCGYKVAVFKNFASRISPSRRFPLSCPSHRARRCPRRSRLLSFANFQGMADAAQLMELQRVLVQLLQDRYWTKLSAGELISCGVIVLGRSNSDLPQVSAMSIVLYDYRQFNSLTISAGPYLKPTRIVITFEQEVNLMWVRYFGLSLLPTEFTPTDT